MRRRRPLSNDNRTPRPKGPRLHPVYWATVASTDEARFLTAILNSSALTQLVAPLQSRGEHNPRDFDKQVWRLPIPLFIPDNDRHCRLVELAEAAEEVAESTDVSAPKTFQAKRRLIREALTAQAIAQESTRCS
jgi:hypothetical protein